MQYFLEGVWVNSQTVFLPLIYKGFGTCCSHRKRRRTAHDHREATRLNRDGWCDGRTG